MPDEIQQFLTAWEMEAQKTIRLLQSLPATQYDFRPDQGGRSLGELAWHLAEVDAYIPYCIDLGRYDLQARPPGIERPRTVEALAPGYQRLHREAAARVRKLKPADMDRTLQFFDGSDMTIRDQLWGALFCHLIHHRGQLTLMCRLAGGTPPGMFGPNREEMATMMKAAKA